jgi:hypothetical protein
MVAADANDVKETVEQIRAWCANNTFDIAENELQQYSNMLYTIADELNQALDAAFGYEDESAFNLVASIGEKLNRTGTQRLATLQRL